MYEKIMRIFKDFLFVSNIRKHLHQMQFRTNILIFTIALIIGEIILTIRSFFLGDGHGKCGGGDDGDDKCVNDKVLTFISEDVVSDRVLSFGNCYTMAKHVYFFPDCFL